MAIVRPVVDQQAFDKWVAERPAVIQEMIRRLPVNRLYRMKSTGHRCTIYSYNEDETITVNVTGKFNRVMFGRRVFGVSPDDLEECDLPDPSEDVGDTAKEAGYSEEDVRDILIPKMRENMTPRK